MFNNQPNQEQQVQIDKIVKRHVNAARRSNRETAFQDCERKGGDAVRKYCRAQGIATLGAHMINAAMQLAEA